MMTEYLIQTLDCSRMLARRWHDYTPYLKLTWNPREDDSVIMAVNLFLQEIDRSFFPVLGDYMDVDGAWYGMCTIPIMPLGIERSVRYGEFGLGTINRVLVAIYETHYYGNAQALRELRRQYGFNTVPKLEALQAHLLKKRFSLPYYPWMVWRSLADLMLYISYNTEHDVLNMTAEDAAYYHYAWDRQSFDRLAAEWKAARLMWERIAWAIVSIKNEMFYNTVGTLIDLAEEMAIESPETCRLPVELRDDEQV